MTAGVDRKKINAVDSEMIVSNTPAPTATTAPTSPGRVTLWDRASFTLACSTVRLLARVLTLNGLYWFGTCFATLEWSINFKRRRRFAKTLKRILGDVSPSDRRRHTRNHFIRTRCDKLFYLVFDRLTRSEATKRFEIVNRSLIDDAIARGGGVYIALSHLGAHHVAGQMLVALGYKVAGVRDAREGAMRRFVQDKYARQNKDRVRYFFTDTYPREIYRCFQDNFIVGSAIDVSRVRNAIQRAIEASIWNEKRPILVGPMRIALRCNAPVLQASIVSKPGFRYQFQVKGPLVDAGVDGRSTDALEGAVRAYAENVEAFGREYPCHVSRI